MSNGLGLVERVDNDDARAVALTRAEDESVPVKEGRGELLADPLSESDTDAEAVTEGLRDKSGLSELGRDTRGERETESLRAPDFVAGGDGDVDDVDSDDSEAWRENTDDSVTVEAPVAHSDGVGSREIAAENELAADSDAAAEPAAETVERREPVPHSEGADADADSLEKSEADGLAVAVVCKDGVAERESAWDMAAEVVIAGEWLPLAGALSRAVKVCTAVIVVETLRRELSDGDDDRLIVADGTTLTFVDAVARRERSPVFDAEGDALAETDALSGALFSGVRVSRALLLGDREALADAEARAELDVVTDLFALNEILADAETIDVNEPVRLLGGLRDAPAVPGGLALPNELTELHAELDGDDNCVNERAPDADSYADGVDRVVSDGEREMLADGEPSAEVDDDELCRGDTDVDRDRPGDVDRLGDGEDVLGALSVAVTDRERRDECDADADFENSRDAEAVSLCRRDAIGVDVRSVDIVTNTDGVCANVTGADCDGGADAEADEDVDAETDARRDCVRAPLTDALAQSEVVSVGRTVSDGLTDVSAVAVSEREVADETLGAMEFDESSVPFAVADADEDTRLEGEPAL